MNVINMSGHRLTTDQLNQIAGLTGGYVGQVIESTVHFDLHRPLMPQVDQLLDSLTIPTDAALVPPPLAAAAACLVVRWQARVGSYPHLVRLVRPNNLVTRFDVAEVIAL